MTPQEVDAIIDAVKWTGCRLCATIIGPSCPSLVCADCGAHVSDHEHEYGLDEEPMAEKFLIFLGLTKDCKNFANIQFTDQVVDHEFHLTDREVQVTGLMNRIRDYSAARQRIIWDRYCALYICHTVDVLVACQGAGRMASFNCFMLVLHEIFAQPYWARFLLSNDPRAACGNKLVVVVAEQLVLHARLWEMQTNLASDALLILLFMKSACAVLGHVLWMQVDKPAAVPLPAKLKGQVQDVLDRWATKWPGNETISNGFQVLFCALLPRDVGYYEDTRPLREDLEGLQKCAKDECTKCEDLYQCSRCQVVLYCSRKHQAADWEAERLPHRQICYQPCF